MASLINRAVDGFKAIRQGLSTVFLHTFKEPITKNYPDEMPTLSPHFRGRLALTVNPESGDHLCISCRQCERVCPDKCIKITSAKSAETNKLELINFEIDHGLCMFCGLCTEVCPTNCIINTNDFEMSEYSRADLIYDLKKLTLSQDESALYFERKEMPLPKPKAASKPAAPAATPAAAAKPAEAVKPAEAAAATAATPAAKPAEAAPATTPAAQPAEAVKADEKPTEAKADEASSAPKVEEKKEEEKKEPPAAEQTKSE
jgi:NADH-quinone oxidoreductase subunit I